MDKKTKKLIVVIVALVISIVCAVLGVSLGVPIETLVPIGTEIIDGLSVDEDAPQFETESFSFDMQPVYATI
ncbi:MAG: hypothetical protein IK048_05565 [Clostridia bacterium]|nr:hypothetical protein [Clostridia bacterium]